MKLLLFLNFSFFISLTSLVNKGYSQENITISDPDQKEFIQFVFTNLETRDQAVAIDNYIRPMSGVFLSRSDINSKKYLIIYYSNSGISESDVINWMMEMNMEFKCLRHGIQGVNKIIDQTIDCE